jgi:hypothetical protein
MDSSIPTFPPPAVAERVLELGFGSGPWTRADLSDRWGDSSANKFIDDAKKAGWMVAPLNNTFYVPPARDLMIVNWLTGLAREEFILSRMLTAAGFRSWCFSAWARSVGIETAEALFVTDLAALAPATAGPNRPSKAPPPKDLADRNRALLDQIGTLPFLENVLLVPFLPQSGRRGEEVTFQLPVGVAKKIQTPNWVLDPGPRAAYPARPIPVTTGAPEMDARRITYPLTPILDDVSWALALLAALGLPRFNERFADLFRTEAQREPLLARAVRTPFAVRLRNWAGLFSPPEPNTNWRTVFQSARTQYLLVPDSLWRQAASLTNAQRFQSLAQLGVKP